MTRYERRIYQVGVACGAAMLITITAVLADECSAKKAVYERPAILAEETTAETTKAPEIGQIETQATEQAAPETTAPETETETEPETTQAQETEAERPKLYRIAGETIPEEIQTALHEALDAEGIGFWYEGGLAQIFQESHGNPAAQNPNGLDKGLLQYRTTYWPQTAAAYGEPGADIFDWRAQVRVYARQTAARINAGLTTDEIISRHKTSDSCPALDTAYIEQVRQWLGQMEEQK